MTSRLAIKKLTASDLTLFEWQFRNRNAGNQKSINLNADVFAGQLYPAIEDATRGSDARLPLDLWIFGPGRAGPLNLQRKIIKGGAYKNWRLDGEFIVNPLDDPDRFNALMADDYVFLAFDGDVVPNAAVAIFVARSVAEDQPLHSICERLGLTGRDTMLALNERNVADIIAAANLPDDHPLANLLLTEDLREAASGGAAATQRLLRGARMPRLSSATLRKARDAAEAIGRLGEDLIAMHLRREKVARNVLDFEWTSQINAIAPYDFIIMRPMAVNERIDVKTTSGPFDREFHVSWAELQEMADGGAYRIFRVYEATPDGAKLRVSEDAQALAKTIVKSLSMLPEVVTIDAFSIKPAALKFGDEIELIPLDEGEEG